MKITRKQLIEEWLEALESGEYKQARNILRTEEKNPRYCCLGVLCDVANRHSKKDYFNDSDNSVLPPALAKFVGISENGEFILPIKRGGKRFGSLAMMNDKGLKFPTIANAIREQLTKRNFEKV